MPELPDIYVLAESMNEALRGKAITDTQVNQPKCLNTTPEKFNSLIKERCIKDIAQRGKWVIITLDSDYTLALNLGMGGEVRLHKQGEQPNPERERVVLQLDTGEQIWIHHWWFGHVLVKLQNTNSFQRLVRNHLMRVSQSKNSLKC